MKTSLSLFYHLTHIGQRQRGLTKIPDTAIQAQLDAFVLPEGAKINLFASEPVVRNPIHMNWDSQGRLWVVGSPLYPHIKPGQEENDQVVVLEDTNGDGVADESVVYLPTTCISPLGFFRRRWSICSQQQRCSFSQIPMMTGKQIIGRSFFPVSGRRIPTISCILSVGAPRE